MRPIRQHATWRPDRRQNEGMDRSSPGADGRHEPSARRAPLTPAVNAPTGDAVELYPRTYPTLLRSTGEIRLRVFEASHKAMGSSLHPLAGSPEVDLGAFLYASRRLPESILQARRVVMGQSAEVFARHGMPLEGPGAWQEVQAPGRRRRWYDDRNGTLAVLVASASDVDDLVPTLVAFQIEWNKLHDRLPAASAPPADWEPRTLAASVGGRADDWAQLHEVWDAAFPDRLAEIARRSLSLRLRLLGG